jgi:hypothetical protein
MTKVELILQGISDGDTIGGPFAMASLVAKALANDPYDFDALDKAYRDYYDSGSFDSGPTFEKVHELMANGYTRNDAVEETHKLFNRSTAGCNPMHRFMVVAGLDDLPYDDLDDMARRDAGLTHYDATAGLCSSVSVRILRQCLSGEKLTDAASAVSSELSSNEQKVFDIPMGNSGYGPEVLVSAIELVGEGKSGLARSIEFAGPNNYCPPVVGALINAMNFQELLS